MKNKYFLIILLIIVSTVDEFSYPIYTPPKVIKPIAQQSQRNKTQNSIETEDSRKNRIKLSSNEDEESESDLSRKNGIRKTLQIENQEESLRIKIQNSRTIHKQSIAKNLAMYVSLPDNNNSYKKTFDSEKKIVFSAPKLNSINKEMRTFWSNDQYQKHKFIGGFSEFKNSIKKTKNDFIIIAGHNENGLFHWYNGKATSLLDIANACKLYKKSCIFLSCESKKYVNAGFDEKISFNDVSFYIKKTTELFDQNKINKENFHNSINDYLSKISYKSNSQLTFKEVFRNSKAINNQYIISIELRTLNRINNQNALEEKEKGMKKQKSAPVQMKVEF